MVDFCVRALACLKKRKEKKSNWNKVQESRSASRHWLWSQERTWVRSLLAAYTQTVNHVLAHFSQYSLFLNEIKTDLCSHPSADSHFTGTSYYSIVTGTASAPPWTQSWRQPSEDTLYLAGCRRLSTFLRCSAVSLHHGQTWHLPLVLKLVNSLSAY